MSVSVIRAGRAYVELTVVANKLYKGLDDARSKGAKFTAGAKENLTTAFRGARRPDALVRGVTGSTGAQFAALTEQTEELRRRTSWTAAQNAHARRKTINLPQLKRKSFVNTE